MFAVDASSPMAHPPHGPLARTNTAPMFSANSGGGLKGLTQTMSHQPRTAHLSGSTAVSSISSNSTLVPTPTQTPVNGGGIVATNNIINQKADASKSLYQICVNLRSRLAQVPGFYGHMHDHEMEFAEDQDPVSALWTYLRKGTPLMPIYNTLQPTRPLVLDPVEQSKTEQKKAQLAAYKFNKACKEDLHMALDECFAQSDLFGDDTTGFVKVTQVINVVLDEAERRGFLLAAAPEEAPAASLPGSQMSYRDHVVRELVDTERKYVQDLENLHELKKVIEHKGVITGDVVHDIFLNINAILDFQRRFLIKIETTNSMSSNRQEWGAPFANYEEAFAIYQPFIANQRKAAAIAQREFDKIAQAEHPVVVDFNTLDAFLLKPMQRLVKYPLLLKDLRDKGGGDEATKADLTAGIEASNRVLMQANAAVDRELRNEALADLCTRVDDWKNHRVDHFGDLLLYGHFPVVTGKADVQKEYTIYLFEKILLCCKEVSMTKPKDKLIGQKDKKDKKDKKVKPGDKNAKLQLKGRIFMTNVTEVLSLAKQGSYTIQIFWKADPAVENFIIRFSNEELMKKWYNGVDEQRKEHAVPLSTSTGSPEVTPTEFPWLRDQAAAMPNPYTQDDDDDDDYEPPPGLPGHPGTMPRNASNNSLRSRPMTGESTHSLAGIARAPAPRFNMGHMAPALSLQTQMPGGFPSPGLRGGDSYFSPVAESPAPSMLSMRSSTQSQTFPFPRQGTPNHWEDNNRYTAPARASSRDSQSGSYGSKGPQRPSLPAMASQNAQQNAALQRSRSYSTPDINNQPGARRLPNGQIATAGPVPAVPGIPAHLAYDGGISRSQNASPNGIPIRTSTQSPGIQQQRMGHQHSQSNGGSYPSSSASHMSQYHRGHNTQASSGSNDPRTLSPSAQSTSSAENDIPLPTQLKVKVNCDGNYVTLVVAFNITYQSLIDRIDAKIGRFSNNAIARGTMRLRYRDEDGDFVNIESDDDIQMAFQEWREAQRLQSHNGALGEIELFCLRADH